MDNSGIDKPGKEEDKTKDTRTANPGGCPACLFWILLTSLRLIQTTRLFDSQKRSKFKRKILRISNWAYSFFLASLAAMLSCGCNMKRPGKQPSKCARPRSSQLI